jgi:ABC-type phosphate transport system substrate-binding protein
MLLPDITDASRAMKASKYTRVMHSVGAKVVRSPIGIDGLTFIQNKGCGQLSLTQTDILQGTCNNLR